MAKKGTNKAPNNLFAYVFYPFINKCTIKIEGFVGIAA